MFQIIILAERGGSALAIFGSIFLVNQAVDNLTERG